MNQPLSVAPLQVQTVGQLRAALAQLPNDMLVIVPEELASTGSCPTLVVRRIELLEGMGVPMAYLEREGAEAVLILFPT